jgi:GMP synthase (glutamine-hydrolysing)
MKPVLILQHLSADDPAYFGNWLQRQGVPFEVRNTEAGQDFPPDLSDHAALAVLGGEMSANDPLPSLRRAEGLIREAMAGGKPVIGHCLGGQLMARALGVRVVDSPAPEVGWQPLQVDSGEAARRWFGPVTQATVFQWHYESFELPPGAEWLARSDACPHQAYAIGPHLGLQFHIEVDVRKVTRWSLEDGPRWQQAARQHPTVQDADTLRAGLQTELAAHQALADRLYAQWLQGVPRG